MRVHHDKAAVLERKKKRRHAVLLIERDRKGYGASVPDLPGCVATGKTLAEVRRNIREAIAFYNELLEKNWEPVPEPTSTCATVRVRTNSRR